MVSYDDATSFGEYFCFGTVSKTQWCRAAAKGDFIVASGLAGFSMWQAGGDSNDILLDSIRGAIGDYAGSSGGC